MEVETNVRSMSFYPGFIQTLSNLFEETSLKQSPLSHLFEVTSIAVSNLDVYRSNSDSEAIVGLNVGLSNLFRGTSLKQTS